MSRPSKRHANIIRNRGLVGYDDDQLARFLGVTREVMNRWAKISKEFALALEAARKSSREFWLDIDQRVSERDQHDRELAAAAERRNRRSHGAKQADATLHRLGYRHPLVRDELLLRAKAERERAPNSIQDRRPSSPAS